MWKVLRRGDDKTRRSQPIKLFTNDSYCIYDSAADILQIWDKWNFLKLMFDYHSLTKTIGPLQTTPYRDLNLARSTSNAPNEFVDGA